MQIEKKKISELVPAPYNPRKIAKKELEKLKNSIKEFGYVEPIIWNRRTGYVIGGHQRLKALQEQGIQKIECVIVDLPEDKEKALNVALNKISGEWDTDKLAELFNELQLPDIDIDLTLTGFSSGEFENVIHEAETGYYGDEREKTCDLYRFNEYDETRVEGYYDFPTLEVCHYIPDDFIGFNYVKSIKEAPKNTAVHFFIDDYQFERIWREPYRMFDRMKKKGFSCVITPDFSTYDNMPLAMKIWNMYRSRMIGQMMQDYGFNVIPNIRYFGEGTLEFCFDGLPEGGVIVDSTVGIVGKEKYLNMFADEMDYAIKKLHPECVIMYGNKIDYDFGKTKVRWIKPKWFKYGGVKDNA